MSVVLGVGIPVILITLGSTVSWTFWAFLAVYVFVFVWSDHAKRVGRVGVLVAPTTRSTVVLGGGWSWVLRSRWNAPNAIVCRRGRAAQPGWWHAGTSLREVQESLAKEHRTLAGHPSILSATLGGWIGSKSHGTGGSLWTPTMGKVLVEEAGSMRTLGSKKYVNVDTMIVREVELFSVPNVVCERRVSYLTSQRDVSTHLFDVETHLRAVFIDCFQSMCIAWVPTQDNTLSRGLEFPPLWLLMAFPARARRDWDTTRWTKRMTLRSANAFGPDPPFFFATAAIAFHLNFEIFVRTRSSPELIWKLCHAFQTLFHTHSLRGRMELRFGSHIQFLDMDIVRGTGSTDVVFQTVRSVYGPDVVFELHPGKAQVFIP